MKQFNVLSLFDGCSMGRLALHTMGIEVSNYYASEVDKYSEGVSRIQFPDIIRLGDVNKIDFSKLPKIDLLIAGFPCQSFSVSGSQKGLNESRGQLFYKVLEAIKILKPKYFLLENVRMKKEFQDTITQLLSDTVEGGFEVIPLNSSLVSAQNRQRLYWTNIPLLHTIKDKGILLKDIIDSGRVDRDKSYCIDANYFKGGNLKQYLTKKRRQLVYKDFTLFPNPQKSPLGLIHLGNINIKGNESIKRFYSQDGKSSTVTTSQGGHRQPKVYFDSTLRFYSGEGKAPSILHTSAKSKTPKYLEKDYVRMLSVNECERLQTLPDNYTELGEIEGVEKTISNTQRYKMIGNGFTVDIIMELLKGMRSSILNQKEYPNLNSLFGRY